MRVPVAPFLLPAGFPRVRNNRTRLGPGLGLPRPVDPSLLPTPGISEMKEEERRCGLWRPRSPSLTSPVAMGKLLTVRSLSFLICTRQECWLQTCWGISEKTPGGAWRGARRVPSAGSEAALVATARRRQPLSRTPTQLPPPARGKSTGCASAGGVSYKTKGNAALGGATGRHRSYQSRQDPEPKASRGRGCRAWGGAVGSAGTQARFMHPDVQHSF